MQITIYCGKCGKKLKVDRSKAGKETTCLQCKAKLPVPSSDLDKPQIRLYCYGCGARVRAMLEEAGGDMRCPKCKQVIPLPMIDDELVKVAKKGPEREKKPEPKRKGKPRLELRPDVEKALAEIDLKKKKEKRGRPPMEKGVSATRDITAVVDPIDVDRAGNRMKVAILVAIIIVAVILMGTASYFLFKQGGSSGKTSSKKKPAAARSRPVRHRTR